VAIGIVAVFLIGVLVVLARRSGGSTSTEDPMAVWMPARDTALGAIAALERLEQSFGETMSDDQRTALRADIESLQSAYFGPDAELDDASLRPQVEQWVLQLA
jgi:hypothetical protein